MAAVVSHINALFSVVIRLKRFQQHPALPIAFGAVEFVRPSF